MKTHIGVIDDHQLFLKCLSMMVDSFKDFEITLEALNGKDMQEKMEGKKQLPEIMLIDVNMEVMDGFETAKWLNKNHPEIKLVALSMDGSDKIIINMIKSGCCAYLLKDTHPTELEKALAEIHKKGYYNGDASNINFRRLMQSEKEEELLHISEREKQFMQLSCSDKTYKEIASEMKTTERAVDGYRGHLFSKLNVQSRVGLVLEALRRGFAKI